MIDHEIQRLAAAMHILRPDWPEVSLRTFISSRMSHYPYRDAVVALAWVTCEPATSSPARVLQAGPWWRAAAVDGTGSNRDNAPRHLRCSVCSLSRDRCLQIWADDHDFEPIADRKLPAEQINAVVTELKGHLEPMRAGDKPREALHGERKERGAAACAVLQPTHTDTEESESA